MPIKMALLDFSTRTLFDHRKYVLAMRSTLITASYLFKFQQQTVHQFEQSDLYIEI
jgi:hypothetical protein